MKNIDIKDSNLLNHCITIINQNIKTIINGNKEYIVLKSINKKDIYYINVYSICKSKNKYTKTIFIKNTDIKEYLNNDINNIDIDFIKKIENNTLNKKKKI